MKSKILLVEDDEKIVKALTIRLQSQGYEVVAAYAAVMVTAKAMEHHPNVILLDISMPGGTGFAVAEQLRDSSITTVISFIFITASKKLGFRGRAKEFGAVAFLEKPFEAQELLSIMKYALTKHTAQAF